MIRKLLYVLILILLVGCQKDFDDGRGGGANPDGSVRFSLKTEDDAIYPDNVSSRGVPRKSLEEYDSVFVNVFSHTSDYWATTGNDVEFFREIKLNQQDEEWKYTPPMYWPVDEKLSFIAYASDIPFVEANISFLPLEGAPKTITYSVPSDVTKQPDLIVSTKYNQQKVGNVSLTMRHALACVSFCGTAPYAKTYVKSITLRNVYSRGTLTLDAPSIEWDLDLDSKGLTALEPGIKNDEELGEDPLQDKEYLMTTNGYLMMIPQKLTNAAIDVLYWNGKDDKDNKTMTYVLPVNDDLYASWRPGKRYIYKFGSQAEEDITVVYYEKYADNSYGLYYYDNRTEFNSIIDTQEIVEAGYGVLTTSSIGPVAPIGLGDGSSIASGSVVELSAINSFLYPVNQSGTTTFDLPTSAVPLDVYFNNSDKSCGLIVPNFAKGVYVDRTPVRTHAIRTPQQMRNISALSASSVRKYNTYIQELNLDFSKASIGGGLLSASVVNSTFNDLFDGQKKRIENVSVSAMTSNGALFMSNSGEIKDVLLLNSSISSSNNAGGIVATNEKSGLILHPRVMGEDNGSKKFAIQGSLYVGAIAGLNYGEIKGNTDIEVATEIPMAEVSGWGLIKGISQPVGGITGENVGTLSTCLVCGVFVTGDKKGEVIPARITIEGGNYVGGVVGVNRAMVIGNHSSNGAEPDVAGMVTVAGNSWVGGIAGANKGSGAVLDEVNLRLGRGTSRDDAIIITGQVSVGGIVGINEEGGTLQASGDSFISVRGNVKISGTENVGGIVGNNQFGNISNCFVYNFYSQSNPLVHYAPRIEGSKNVGGIVGYAGANAVIKDCAVFSTVSIDNAGGENVNNAMAEIIATGESAGGIVGRGFTGLNLSNSYVLGNVKVDSKEFSGGIMGQNNIGTVITSVHIGNHNAEVTNIYNNLFHKVKLPVDDPRMKTGGGVMTYTSGTPTIVGTQYVGGICGSNWGKIEGVAMKDNVKIGTSLTNFVGGISGGNGKGATIRNCQTYNPLAANLTVLIEGAIQVGGIVGLNNGIVDQCQLGLPGNDKSRLISIKGSSAVGGIAGTTGGIKESDANTSITSCNVYGKVLVEATKYRAGGIIGEVGPTNKVVSCNVTGYKSIDGNSAGYDVTVKGRGSVGGIAGENYGHIYGTSSVYSRVTHTAVIAADEEAGGLVGILRSHADSSYRSELYYCDVSYGVLVYNWTLVSGAFVGNMEGVGATTDSPMLFGTSSAAGGPTNKIYMGSSSPVRVSSANTLVALPPTMANMTYPPDPPTTGNLWAKYQMYNYLYHTIY